MTWQPAIIVRRLVPLREAASYLGLAGLTSELVRLGMELGEGVGRRRG